MTNLIDPNRARREIEPRERRVNEKGYVELTMPDHPLAQRNGIVLEHRLVLWSATGGRDQRCYWCGWLLPWRHEEGQRHCINVDHLNERRDDNDLKNLVPSCWYCNANRSWSRFAPLTWRELIETYRDLDPNERPSAIIWLAERAETGLENAMRTN